MAVSEKTDAPDSSPDQCNLLEVRGLKTSFNTEEGIVRAVRGVDLSLPRNTTLGVVGESGCGKSITALSIMRLVRGPSGHVDADAMLFDGQDLLAKSPKEMRRIRGKDIAMIFQEPMTSLNPVQTIGAQIMEAVRLHMGLDKQASRERAIEMLKRVGIPAAERRVDDYPHNLSGGMRQRAMIAMALSCDPKLLIADEPTTALDVTIQAQILDLMNDLKQRTGTSILLITHDLGVIAETAQFVVVMYLGKVVEKGTVRDILDRPRHPYTAALLKSMPRLSDDRERLEEIRGMVPSPTDIPPGCGFNPRCHLADDMCRHKEPELALAGTGHWSACWKTGEVR